MREWVAGKERFALEFLIVNKASIMHHCLVMVPRKAKNAMLRPRETDMVGKYV
jgi:hypothetical protein